ncbi:cation:proton antiporter [Streptomyces sp. NPDC029080]|uniref:cation:proton antiporter n=1 Tax=Streptomyces sp. NPDC029080 TaxID=3155017 RepID=UPI0033E33A42
MSILAFRAVPPPPPHQMMLFLLQAGVLLALAFCLGRLAVWCGLPAVVGELATGVLLGPAVLGATAPGVAAWLLPARADQAHLLDALSQFAVLLLVGVAGAHLDPRLIRRRRGVLVSVGSLGLLVPFALGVAAGCLVPVSLLGGGSHRATFALFLGVALSVSAIPVVAKSLSDMNLLHRDVGQLIMACAAVEDAAAWFLLSLVSSMAAGSFGLGDTALAAARLTGFVAVAVVARPLVRRLFRRLDRSGDSGPVSALAVTVILLSGAAAQALELESVFGAFVAGLLIASAVDPLRLTALREVTLAVLAPLFLACAGLRADLTALRDPGVALTGAVLLVLAMAGKLAGASLGARLSGLSRWEGVAIGAGLNARGAVEIVVAGVGLRLGVLTTATYTVVVLIAVLTSVTAPLLLRRAMTRVEKTAEEELREADALLSAEDGERGGVT